MKIVVAPDSFKESLPAAEAAAAIARGLARARPDARIEQVPMADGGEGTVDALLAATGGSRHRARVAGPLGDPVEAVWGMLGDGSGTAVLEMASASGLALVPPARRDPAAASTLGTGQLILACLAAGARRVLIGIGGSATNDGGAGAAQAIGVRFLDAGGRPLPDGIGGGRLDEITRIDLRGRHPAIGRVPITVACDVDNPLCGPGGASAVFGPQKGAGPEMVARLDRNLAHLADVAEQTLGRRLRDIPGTGAAGGLGFGLLAFFDARMRPGVEIVMEAAGLRERLRGADLVVTGEGRIDRQSMMGKVIAGVGRAAAEVGVPAVALVGSVGEGAEETLGLLRSYHPINPPGTPREEALARTAEALEQAAYRLLAEG